MEIPKKSLCRHFSAFLANFQHGFLKILKICDALRNLVYFVQFKNREKHSWKSVIFLVKPATLLKLTLLHGSFSRFLNCTNLCVYWSLFDQSLSSALWLNACSV